MEGWRGWEDQREGGGGGGFACVSACRCIAAASPVMTVSDLVCSQTRITHAPQPQTQILNHQPSTQSHNPQTLNPEPSFLNPAHQTLSPKLRTPNLELYTLTPKPKPQTLRSKRSTLVELPNRGP